MGKLGKYNIIYIIVTPKNIFQEKKYAENIGMPTNPVKKSSFSCTCPVLPKKIKLKQKEN